MQLREAEDRLLAPVGRDHLARPGRARRRIGARTSPRSPRAAPAGLRPSGSPSDPRAPSTSACRIAGSVGSRGSPWPKSRISIPASAASRFARSIRTNGYVPCAARTGETCTPERYPPCQTREAPERLERALELGDLDALVAAVRVPRRAGAEVDRVEPLAGELRDGRPGLLRLEREIAGLAEPLHERRVGRDVRRRRVRGDLEIARRPARAGAAPPPPGVRLGAYR